MKNNREICFSHNSSWSQVFFKDIAERVSLSGKSGMLPYIEFDDIISGEGKLNKNIFTRNVCKVGKIFMPEDVLFGKLRPYLKNIFFAETTGIAVGDFWVLRSNGIDPYILFLLVNSQTFMRVANVSSGSKMPRADWKLVANMKIAIPESKLDQKSISNFFKSFVSYIEGVTNKLTSLKQIKSACLQSMFPQEGESVPKVRFKGFNEEWIKYTLSDIFIERHEISTITDDLPQLSFTISEGIIYPQDRKSNKRDFLIKDKQNKKYLVTYKGDIIYNPANVVFGAIHRNSLCNGVVSPIYKIFSTEQDSKFMECIVRNPKFISSLSMKTEGTVTKLKTLNPKSFLEMEVMITPSLAEQQKIAAYFENLDKQISLQTQRLEKLKQIKSACLDKMFI